MIQRHLEGVLSLDWLPPPFLYMGKLLLHHLPQLCMYVHAEFGFFCFCQRLSGLLGFQFWKGIHGSHHFVDFEGTGHEFAALGFKDFPKEEQVRPLIFFMGVKPENRESAVTILGKWVI